jgi:hypothetical protein
MSHDYGEAFRAAIAGLAFLSAGWQLSMRLVWARGHPNLVGKRERVGAWATAILLTGVGLANLQHLSLAVTISSAVVTIGIVGSLWANWRIYEAIKYLDERETDEAHRDDG